MNIWDIIQNNKLVGKADLDENGKVPVEQIPAFDKFRDYVHRNSTEGYMCTFGAGGGIATSVAVFYYYTGALAGRYAYSLYNLFWGGYQKLMETGKKVSGEWVMSNPESIVSVIRYLYFTKNAVVTPDESKSHIGFKIVDARIWASSCDGTNPVKLTDTNTNITIGSQRLRLRFEVDNDAKFYIDDILVATHTTNLPTEGDYRLNEGLITNEAAQKVMRLGRFLLEVNL